MTLRRFMLWFYPVAAAALILSLFCSTVFVVNAETASSPISSTTRINEIPILKAAVGVGTTTEIGTETTTTTKPTSIKIRKLVVAVDGGTESIRACCFEAETGKVIGKACAVPYRTYHPHPGWAEQHPSDWYDNLGQAVRAAVQSAQPSYYSQLFKGKRREILAICVDTTCCSVVALDRDGNVLRPCLLWMDQRAGASQTKEIMERAKGDPALQVNCGGHGPLSAEWMISKAFWIYQNEPDVWKAAATICEYQDYINLKLTGQLCASSCNAATRWHWNGETCIVNQSNGTTTTDSNSDNNSYDNFSSTEYPGRPLSLYRTLGIPELAEKLPKRCYPMGAKIGHLTNDAAQHLGLPEGLPVIQGGPDAFVGMLGLGCIEPGQLCLITGSSHLHCVVSAHPTTAPGTWGAYRGAPLPGLNFAEGGQSSTGSIIRWARTLFNANDVSYKELDQEAALVRPGADGLVALETFQGSRTPVTDPLARGALIGLTLSHSRAHIWRALMEAVCFGTRACIEGLGDAGHGCDEIIIAGGITRSEVWLQMHADVTGKPVVVCENTDAPLLGCAILAATGVGIHASVKDAVRAMVRTAKRVECHTERSSEYDWIYKHVYRRVAAAVRPVTHELHEHNKKLTQKPTVQKEKTIKSKKKRQKPIISPSLLACDWSKMCEEVCLCIQSGAPRLHVDIFDGVFLDSPRALTFGPQMVQAIRKSCNEMNAVSTSSGAERAILDLHMCVERPGRYVSTMAEAGADRFIFQWEAMVGKSSDATTTSAIDGDDNDNDDNSKLSQAVNLATEIVAAGMQCGVSINPETDIDEILPLLESNIVDLVDILAVEPGFGGQTFQKKVLQKMERLKRWRDFSKLSFEIMVDGGVNEKTASDVIAAGADILVAGSFLFNHPAGVQGGIRELMSE